MPGISDTSHSPHAALTSLPLRDVALRDGFWRTRCERNRTAGLPRLFELLEEHGAVDNLRRLAGKPVERRGLKWTDSDVAKWLEGACYVLQTTDDAALRGMVDTCVEAFVGAQGDDGYLNSWFVDDRAGERWRHLDSDHELYCAGHIFQAAIAHHRIAGETTLLDAACRYADYLDSVFGPGKLEGSPGHPEIELALVELFRTTGEERYLKLAGYFLEHRGLRQMTELEGHAVRALYFMCGATDLLCETGDAEVDQVVQTLWRDLTERKLYLTGGVGGRYGGESIGKAYELPNARAYAETCAAIGNLFWQWRLLQHRPEVRYADAMETALYNGVLAGVSLSGTDYFYVNPLASDGRGEGDPWYPWARRGPHQRRDWYDCTCCPPNVTRLLASLPGYLYGLGDDGLYLHGYAASTVDTTLRDGRPLKLEVETDYPWRGEVTVTVGTSGRFALYLRVPEWAEGASLLVAGAPMGAEPGQYARVEREWRAGDSLRLSMDLVPRLLTGNHRHRECHAQVAVLRGPLVYCLESSDNAGFEPMDVFARLDGAITAVERPELLDGVTVLSYQTVRAVESPPLHSSLGPPATEPVDLTLIPYYAWANRGPSAMQVWMPSAR